jgi:predicted dithiol-disulfide oxidoreductase (DUF899 family)
MLIGPKRSTKGQARPTGSRGERPLELPGLSCFLREGDSVYHTYSTYSRGGEVAITSYHLLDLTALGRQEVWEAPKGRVDHPYPPVPSFATERLLEK